MVFSYQSEVQINKKEQLIISEICSELNVDGLRKESFGPYSRFTVDRKAYKQSFPLGVSLKFLASLQAAGILCVLLLLVL